jgi:hypothetical protein
MDVVNAEAVDFRAELGEAIDLGLVRPPVVVRPPILDELPQVGEIGAVLPSGIGHFVGKARARQALAEVFQDFI